MKRPDLIVVIAAWEFITAFGALIGVAGISVFAFPHVIGNGGPPQVGALFGLSLAVLLLMCYTGLAAAGGIGLLQAKQWGRILSIIHAALTLLWIPIGTVIGILILVYLTRPELREYFKGSGD